MTFLESLTGKESIVTGWQLGWGLSRGRHFIRSRGKSMCICRGQRAAVREVKGTGAGVCLVGGASQVLEVTGGMEY